MLTKCSEHCQLPPDTFALIELKYDGPLFPRSLRGKYNDDEMFVTFTFISFFSPAAPKLMSIYSIKLSKLGFCRFLIDENSSRRGKKSLDRNNSTWIFSFASYKELHPKGLQ